MKTLALLFVVACFQIRAASYLGPEIGQMAPVVKVAKWLQPAVNASEGWPTGKVVVLEFWATWCGPCVVAIPHLNELAEQFKDQPVQFIAITDEEENTVRSFLKKTPIKAWVGLTADQIFGETNRSLHNLAEGLEHSVGKPVLDETGMTNLYSFNLKWNQKDEKHPNPEGMTTAVNELGLELVPEKRTLEFVVVRTESKE